MKFIEIQEVRDRFTGSLFSYEDHYSIEKEEDLKEFPENRIGDRVIKRRVPDFEVRRLK